MRMLWALEEGTVHTIRARLLPERPLAYTTIMTVMDRLARKGLVQREKQGRSYRYRPSVSPQTVCDHALSRLSRNFFQGSRERLRDYLEKGEARLLAPRPAPVAGTPRPLEQTPAPPPEGIDPSLL